MQSVRRRIRATAVILTLLALIAFFDWQAGENLAFASLYFLPIVLAGFAFRPPAALSIAVLTAALTHLRAPSVEFETVLGSREAATVLRTVALCVTAASASWLGTAYRHHVHRLIALHELSVSINSALRVSETLELVARHSASLTKAAQAYLFLRRPEDETLSIAATFGDRSAAYKDVRIDISTSGLGALLRRGQPQRFYHLGLPGPLPDFVLKSARALMSAPLVVRDESLGLILVVSPTRRSFARDDLESLHLLANAAAIALKEAQQYERTEEQAITDSLTGLHNYRYFKHHFGLELGRAQRRQGVLSLIIFDIDNFKRINDTYGHLTGDRVLRDVARVARTMVRRTDMLARVGGEEFAILLPESNRDDATAVAEKLRMAIAESEFDSTDNRDFRLTVSAGVAAYPLDATEPDILFEVADKAMYRAKSSGRNRVFPDPETQKTLLGRE